MKFAVRELVGQDCLSAEEGERVYSIIHPRLHAGESVTLDFEGVRVVVSLFLNQAIGRLYADIPFDAVQRNLTIDNLSEPGKFALRRVADNSKAYYSSSRFHDAVDQTIDRDHE